MLRRNRKRTSALKVQPRKRRLEIESLEVRWALSAVYTTPHIITPNLDPMTIDGYMVDQIRAAYGFDKVSFGSTPADGSGQTIAIVDAYGAPTIEADLAVFDEAMGLPPPPSFKIVNQYGGSDLPPPDPTGGWEGETALDVEWAHAIAPGANILLVQANTPTDADLFAAINYARHYPGVSVISMSFGRLDMFEDQALSKMLTSEFLTTPTGHAGVTFVASTGDYSITGFPAVSPNVLAVGGTNLQLNADNSIDTESAWGYNFSIVGSGGGVSQNFYTRGTPDVAYDADPATGFAIYNSYPPDSGWLQIGGTSAGAPQWAALIAIVNQGRALAGFGPLDGPSQTLPAVRAGTAFLHDIVNGRTYFEPAGIGYDLATGWGTPIADQLIPYMVSYGTGQNIVFASPVQNFSGSASSSSAVQLTWGDAAGATSYDLYGWRNDQPYYIASYNPSSHSATLNGLSAGTSYRFNVVANSAAGAAGSQWVTVTTSAAAVATQASVQSFTGAATSASTVQLTWGAATGATSYDLYGWKNNQPYYIATYGASARAATVSGLAASTAYRFNVVANGPAGAAGSPWITVTTPAAATSSPAAVQDFAGSATSPTSVQLSWGAATGATGYDVYGWKNNQPYYIASYGASARAASVSGLAASSSNRFNVVANSSAGAAGSPWITVTTPAAAVASAPAAVQNFAGVATSATVAQLTWDAAAGATSYDLYGWKNNQPYHIASYSSASRSATVSGLSSGLAYRFNVVAVSPAGSAGSPWISVTMPTAVVSNAISTASAGGLQVAATSASTVQLTWGAVPGATGYRIYELVGGQPVVVGTYAAGATSATISGLKSATSYSFALVADSASGSTTSNWVSVTTKLTFGVSSVLPQRF